MSGQVKQCAHPACDCTVPEGQEFCCDYCKTAGKEEVEISCDCGHPGCALTDDEPESTLRA